MSCLAHIIKANLVTLVTGKVNYFAKNPGGAQHVRRYTVKWTHILIRSNKMQQYAGIYLLQIYSTCFGCP